MIPIKKFVETINHLLLDPLKIESSGFVPSYSTEAKNFRMIIHNQFELTYGLEDFNGRCLWWHEEPLNFYDLNDLKNYNFKYNADPIFYYESTAYPETSAIFSNMKDVNFWIFANSEISNLKSEFLSNWKVSDWYFFFHGFAALDWFRAYRYLNHKNSFPTKLFISLNHLVEKKRSYRLHLLSLLNESDLTKHGHVSFPTLNQDIIKKEIFSPDTYLSKTAKKTICNNLYYNRHNSMPYILDDCADYNLASADIIRNQFTRSSLFHLVTETNYFEQKLHLTEKTFKPIVTRRPFILVGGAGNLAYLKKYGFRTFDKWINEDYDNILDNDLRLEMIVEELKKLSYFTQNDLKDLYHDMQETLDYNHEHFFTNFKNIIVDELLDNFVKCVREYNKDLSQRFQLPLHNIDLNYVKKLLIS